jgi:hypothetical protein
MDPKIGYVIRIDEDPKYAAQCRAENPCHITRSVVHILPGEGYRALYKDSWGGGLRMGYETLKDAQEALDRHIAHEGHLWQNSTYTFVKITVTEEDLPASQKALED